MRHDDTQRGDAFRLLSTELVRAHVIRTEDDAAGHTNVVIRLNDGTELQVPAANVSEGIEGLYYLPLRLEFTSTESTPTEPAEQHIPVVEEELKVGKRTVHTGAVTVTKQVHEREEIVDLPLERIEVEVVRVPVNEIVDRPVPMRTEDGVTIIPVLEEIQVVEKRLLLKEEVHIRRKLREEHHPQRVQLRREEVVIERDNNTQVRS
jgi:uncharacterized protein (TIGR02271 family)